MADPLDLEGRVVLVTGGTRGLGRAIATRFLDAGSDVAVCSRTEPDSPLTARDGRRAWFTPVDVRDPVQVDAWVRDVAERHERIDVLVNNAGGAPPADTATASARFSEAIVRLNLLAPLFCSQAVNPVMQAQDGGGCIVNIASVSGMRPSPGAAAYGAAKAGLLGLTQTLAVELAPKVRVNAVTVGLVESDEAAAHYGGPDAASAVRATVPLGRLATGDDVAGPCLFLASALAAHVSGANLVVHGGGEPPAYLVASRLVAPSSAAHGPDRADGG